MPCYSRVTSTVEFSDSTDVVLLAKAMQALGYQVMRQGKGFRFDNGTSMLGSFEGGRMTLRGEAKLTVEQTNEIKRAYSTEVVKAASQRFGWQVKQSSPTQFQVQRRY